MFGRLLYRSYRVMHAVQSWIRRRFTAGGKLVLTGLIFSAVLGVDTNLTMAYQIFTLLLFLLVMSFLGSVFFRASLAVRRILPQFGSVDQPLPYRLQIRNTGSTLLRGLTVQDELADTRPSLEAFVRAREPGEDRRNWFDRNLGYFRWCWLVSRNEPSVAGEQSVPALPPGGDAELRRELVPVRRGQVRFAGITAAREDPFGLFNAFVRVPFGGSVLILPKRYPLPPIQLPGSRAYQQGRVAMASSVGDSEEFVSLRDYRPGDPLRRIHWKSWARVGKPIVKEYQEEFFVRHALVLDTFLTGEGGEVFEEAVSVAASFACTIDTQESLLDLMFVGAEAYCVTAGRGLGRTDQLLEILACVQPCTDKTFESLDHLVLGRYSSLSGCICILLSWNEARQHFVSRLHERGVPTLVFVVVDPSRPRASGLEPVLGATGRFHRLEIGKIAEGLARV
jgi:uncharacterized protein (DUF58 family)